jgi:NhaP-type Na+/H+ or K+/H+ antiporter
MLGTDDLLACFVAGNVMNWDGEYLRETEDRHDEVNSCMDVLLNFGGFMYIGTIIPWSEFNQPDDRSHLWTTHRPGRPRLVVPSHPGHLDELQVHA